MHPRNDLTSNADDLRRQRGTCDEFAYVNVPTAAGRKCQCDHLSGKNLEMSGNFVDVGDFSRNLENVRESQGGNLSGKIAQKCS